MENKIIVDCIKAMSSGNRIFVKMAKRVGLKPDATIPSPNYEEAGKPCFFVTKARFLDDANSGRKSSFNQDLLPGGVFIRGQHFPDGVENRKREP